MAKSTIHSDFVAAYGREASSLDLASQEFRLSAIRPDIGPPAPIDGLVEQVEWRDEGTADNLNIIPVLRGSMSVRLQDTAAGETPFVLRDGHRVRCEVKWFGAWKPLWEMRIQAPPERTVEDGTATMDLADDLVLASQSEGMFRYRAGKKRKRRGWLYHEIVIDVCKRYRIPCGPLVKGTKRLKNFAPTGQPVSPLEAIRLAVEAEQGYTGKRMLIAWRPDGSGRFCLHVTHPVRNPLLYVFADQIRNATVSPVRRAMLATAVVATGTSKKKGKGKSKKYAHREVSAAAVKQFGYVERRVKLPGYADGKGDVVAKAKRDLAKNLKPVRNISNFIHYGIAFVRRGDTVEVSMPYEGFVGEQGFLFVTSVVHTLSGTDYTMSLNLTWRDPLDPNKLREEREKAMRARKRAARGKKKT
ncbi:MAG: hypothetical protein ABW167_20630 [Baekduia sp.]